MARSVSVFVPKVHAVQFPDRCPVCGKAHPGHEAKLGELFGLLQPVSSDVLKRWQQQVPVCREHARRVRNARLSDILSLTGLTLASLAALVYLAGRYEMFAAGWWSWGGVVLLGLILPKALVSLVARPLFDLRSDDELVEVMVRNRDYASEFAALNRAASPPAGT
jgi:hypothetical protein